MLKTHYGETLLLVLALVMGLIMAIAASEQMTHWLHRIAERSLFQCVGKDAVRAQALNL